MKIDRKTFRFIKRVAKIYRQIEKMGGLYGVIVLSKPPFVEVVKLSERG